MHILSSVEGITNDKLTYACVVQNKYSALTPRDSDKLPEEENEVEVLSSTPPPKESRTKTSSTGRWYQTPNSQLRDITHTVSPSHPEGTNISQNFNSHKQKVLLLGDSHLQPIITNNFIRGCEVDKQLCFTIEEAIDFVQICNVDYDCIVLKLLTNDIKTKSADNCVSDMSSLVNMCSDKWHAVKIVISAGITRGDSANFNHQMHICNIKLQNIFIESQRVSFCDNSALSIRGLPNIKFFREDQVHLSTNGVRVFATNLKVGIHSALGINREYGVGTTKTRRNEGHYDDFNRGRSRNFAGMGTVGRGSGSRDSRLGRGRGFGYSNRGRYRYNWDN